MFLRGRRRRSLGGDDGTTLIEVGVAMAIMGVAVLAVVGSMGSGMQLVGHSRQRSAGASLATERLERIQNVPYNRLALYEQPVTNGTPGHPDHDVTVGGRYTLPDGSTELLVVDTTDDATPAGALRHIDDPFTLEPEGTEFAVYQYVTWVEDASVGDTNLDIAGIQSYKRAIVVAIWKFPVHYGPEHRVVQSTLISEGSVPAPVNTPAPAPTATPVPTAAPPTPTAACGTMALLSGSGGYTNSTSVQVRLARTAGCAPVSAELSNTGTGTYVPVSGNIATTVTVTWTVPAGDGAKTIYAKFRDGSGTVTSTTADLILDTSPPTTPTGLAKACNGPPFGGNSRTITLTWSASTDPAPGNALVGYRLYKSTDSGSFTAVQIVSTTQALDTDSKGYGIRFTVRAYDKAGNETPDSNMVSVSKNAC